MMSFTQKLDVIKSALLGMDDDIAIYHYWRSAKDTRYIIWQEDSGVDLDAGNHKIEQGASGVVELFTKTENDSCFDKIQEALNTAENVSWYYDGTDFEDETNFIHHSWRWTVL